MAQKAAIKAANAKARSLVGKSAPDFTLPDFSQRTFTLADRRGHVVVLAFWVTWRPPCRAEMPTLARFQKEFALQDVDITPVAFDDSEKAREFPIKKKLEIRSLIDEGGREGGRVATLYGAHVLPKTIVVDRNGIVVKALIGKASESDLRNAIQEARR